MLKTTYERFPPKLIHYRNYKDLSQNYLHNKYATNAASIQSRDIVSLQTAIVKTINEEAPIKKRMARGNNKPHVTSMIRKEIMTTLREEIFAFRENLISRIGCCQFFRENLISRVNKNSNLFLEDKFI